MKRAHRVALKPTPEQESLFSQHAGYARFAYNWALGEYKAGLDVGEWLNHQSLRPRWNRVKGIIAPWSVALSQNAAKYAIIDLGAASERWGEYRKRIKAGQRPGDVWVFPGTSGAGMSRAFGPTTVRTRCGWTARWSYCRRSARWR